MQHTSAMNQYRNRPMTAPSTSAGSMNNPLSHSINQQQRSLTPTAIPPAYSWMKGMSVGQGKENKTTSMPNTVPLLQNQTSVPGSYPISMVQPKTQSSRITGASQVMPPYGQQPQPQPVPGVIPRFQQPPRMQQRVNPSPIIPKNNMFMMDLARGKPFKPGHSVPTQALPCGIARAPAMEQIKILLSEKTRLETELFKLPTNPRSLQQRKRKQSLEKTIQTLEANLAEAKKQLRR